MGGRALTLLLGSPNTFACIYPVLNSVSRKRSLSSCQRLISAPVWISSPALSLGIQKHHLSPLSPLSSTSTLILFPKSTNRLRCLPFQKETLSIVPCLCHLILLSLHSQIFLKEQSALFSTFHFPVPVYSHCLLLPLLHETAFTQVLNYLV